MTSLVLMYVYFDDRGNIKAITPESDSALQQQYDQTMLPLSDVAPFLSGKKNAFDYVIKGLKKLTGTSYVLSKKFSNINLERTLENYLTKIESTSDLEPIIKVTAFTKSNRITVALNESYKELFTLGSQEEKDQVEEFLTSPPSKIYITRKSNPYHYLHSFTFVPRDLYYNGTAEIAMPEHLDIRNSSAYTKRIVSSYIYVVRE